MDNTTHDAYRMADRNDAETAEMVESIKQVFPLVGFAHLVRARIEAAHHVKVSTDFELTAKAVY